MRPQRFKYEVDKAFKVWFKTGSFAVSKPVFREMKRVCGKWSKEFGDYREGHETYGYQDIKHDMIYISDRWQTAFRLRWLIDGIEAGYIK